MPSCDIYHNTFKNALLKDRCTITHDPFKLELGKKNLYVDLRAEQLIGAENAERKIAVEIKSLIDRFNIDDLE